MISSEQGNPPVDQVRSDFDRLALLEGGGPDHNRHYHRFLLGVVPAGARSALEVGCGRGEFARALAARVSHVTAIDLSPVMIGLAREACADTPNLTLVEADALSWASPDESFDFIVSIAMLHHVAAAPLLASLARALRPGGTLAILDLRHPRGRVDHTMALLALPLEFWLRLKSGRLLPDPESRAVWEEHGRRERYLTYFDAREMARLHLPGSRVRRHLLWRYSLTYSKPKADASASTREADARRRP